MVSLRVPWTSSRECASTPDPELVETWANIYRQWLRSGATKKLCSWDTPKASDILITKTGQRLYGTVYIELLAAIRQHVIAGAGPIITSTETPTGAGWWRPSQTAIDVFQNARRNEEPKMFQDQLELTRSILRRRIRDIHDIYVRISPLRPVA